MMDRVGILRIGFFFFFLFLIFSFALIFGLEDFVSLEDFWLVGGGSVCCILPSYCYGWDRMCYRVEAVAYNLANE